MRADHDQVRQLLKTARGQIDGILKKTNRMVLRSHMDCCVRQAMESGHPDEKLDELAALLDKLCD